MEPAQNNNSDLEPKAKKGRIDDTVIEPDFVFISVERLGPGTKHKSKGKALGQVWLIRIWFTGWDQTMGVKMFDYVIKWLYRPYSDN